MGQQWWPNQPNLTQYQDLASIIRECLPFPGEAWTPDPGMGVVKVLRVRTNDGDDDHGSDTDHEQQAADDVCTWPATPTTTSAHKHQHTVWQKHILMANGHERTSEIDAFERPRQTGRSINLFAW